MKKIFLFLILILSTIISIFAQSVKFNRLYNYTNITGGVGTRFNQLIQRNNQYLCFGHFSPQSQRISPIAAKFDSLGNVISWFPFIDTNYNYCISSQNSDIKTNDGGYIINGFAVENQSPYTNYGFLMKLDSNLNIKWKRFYYDTDSNSIWTYPDYGFYSLKVTTDNGFLATGIRFRNSGIATALAVKFDSLGNEQWVKTHLDNKYFSCYTSVIKIPTGEYVFCGGIDTTNNPVNNDVVVIKTDSIGNLIWQKTFGGIKGDGNLMIQNNPDGSIMLFYTKSDSAVTSQGSYYGYYSLQFHKLSPVTGDTIWSMSYGDKKHNQICYAFKVFPDGSAMASGSYGSSWDYPWLLNLNREGTVNWYKEYRPTYPVTTYFHNAIFDLQQTSDSGFIVTGELFIFDSVHENCGWLMKTDKNGCWQANCDTSNNIQSNVKIESSLEVFPNPASTEVTATYFSDIEQGILEIYNTMGTKLMEVKLPKGQNSHKFSVAHLAKGYYKVIIKEKGILRGQVSLLITD